MGIKGEKIISILVLVVVTNSQNVGLDNQYNVMEYLEHQISLRHKTIN